MRKKKKLIGRIGCVILALIILFCGAIYLFQNKLLFHPFHDEEAYQDIQKSGLFEEITLDSDDGRLTGWLRFVGDDAPVLVYFGGRQQCSSDMFQFTTEKEHWSYYEGYNFLCIDYPGYGLSDGSPGDVAMYRMADRVHGYIQERWEDQPDVVVFGYSIGTGVATYYCAQYPVDGLILLAPYRDGTSLFNKQVNIFHGPMKGLVRNKFDSVGHAADINVPSLIFISKADFYMDYDGALTLSDAFPAESEVMIFEDVNHDYFFRELDMLTAVQNYLNEVKK